MLDPGIGITIMHVKPSRFQKIPSGHVILLFVVYLMTLSQ
jgi:hypothetical protein